VSVLFIKRMDEAHSWMSLAICYVAWDVNIN